MFWVGLICIGSAIGSGLFYGSGKVLYSSGPVSLLLAYLLMGSVPYAVLVRDLQRIVNQRYHLAR